MSDENRYFNNSIYDKYGNIKDADANELKRIVPPSAYINIKNKKNKTICSSYVKDDITSPIELGRNISDNYTVMENFSYYLRKDVDKSATVYYKDIINSPRKLSEFENDLNISGYVQDYINSIAKTNNVSKISTYESPSARIASVSTNYIEYFSNESENIYTKYSIITKGNYIFRRIDGNNVIEKTLKLDNDNETLLFDGNFSVNNININGDLIVNGENVYELITNIEKKITQIEKQINNEDKNN